MLEADSVERIVHYPTIPLAGDEASDCIRSEKIPVVTCHRRHFRWRWRIQNGEHWMLTVTPQSLTQTVQEFLSKASGAIVLENGAVAFDLARSKYSISGEHNRCLLHLWSAERNSVRRVLQAEVKNGTLRLAVQRMGQARPLNLEICRERDRRSPSTRKLCRAGYEQKLRRTLERHFPEFKITRLTSGVDLEKSFGPIYAPDPARPLGVCISGSERAGNAVIDQCRAHLRHPVARRLPQGTSLERIGGRAASFSPKWDLGIGAGTHGESKSRCREVVTIRTGRAS